MEKCPSCGQTFHSAIMEDAHRKRYPGHFPDFNRPKEFAKAVVEAKAMLGPDVKVTELRVNSAQLPTVEKLEVESEAMKNANKDVAVLKSKKKGKKK